MSKEFEEEEVDAIRNLKNQLWQSFDMLRGTIYTEDYDIILYLLVLNNYKGFKELLNENLENIKVKLGIYIEKNKPTELSTIDRINQVYLPLLLKWNDRVLYNIIRHIDSLDKFLLKEYFPQIFDSILYKVAKAQGKYGGELLLPLEISRFVCSLANLKLNSTVYNPFSGGASFAVFLNHSSKILCQEINEKTWAISNLRVLAYLKHDNVEIKLGDSLYDWNPTEKYSQVISNDFWLKSKEKEKFDLIISNPPFSSRLANGFWGRFGNIKNADQFLIEKGIEDLKSNGKLIAVISQGILFRGGVDQEIRKFLVENDLIEMIISFPSDMLMHTGIPFAILVINKNKKKNGYVKFIKADSFVIEAANKEKRLNDYALNSLIKEDESSNLIRVVDNENIKAFEYNLNVQRYFQNELKGIQLREIVEVLKVPKVNEGRPVKVIRVSDLKDGEFDYQLDVTIIKPIVVKGSVQEISKSCLLVATRYKNAKPTYFKFEGETIYVSLDVLPLQIDETKVTIEYLIHELNAGYIKEQIESFSIGSVAPRIRVEDWLSLIIKVPECHYQRQYSESIKEQTAKVQGAKEAYLESFKIKLNLERELNVLKEDTFRQFASLKHSFSQYLNALKSNVSGTSKFISNNEGKTISLQSIYSQNLNKTLGEHLLSLEGIIDSMSQLLSNVNNEEASNGISTKKNLIELISEAQNRFKSPDQFEFEKLYVDSSNFILDDIPIEPWVKIFEEDFYRIFANIISNAIDHGFKNSQKKNVIRTSLSLNVRENMWVIEISNNGLPIPELFTLKHLTTRGEKTTNSKGSGIGGADIKNLLEKYGGKLDLLNQHNEEFAVTYIIFFPILNHIENEV